MQHKIRTKLTKFWINADFICKIYGRVYVFSVSWVYLNNCQLNVVVLFQSIEYIRFEKGSKGEFYSIHFVLSSLTGSIQKQPSWLYQAMGKESNQKAIYYNASTSHYVYMPNKQKVFSIPTPYVSTSHLQEAVRWASRLRKPQQINKCWDNF